MTRRQTLSRGSIPRPQEPSDGPRSAPLTALLETWVADRLITQEQAERILLRGDLAVQAPPAAPRRPGERSSLVTEALGYLGGVVILVASILLASIYWDQLDVTVRVLVVGGVAAVLLAAGLAVPARLAAAGTRFRSVLWLLSTGAFAGFVALLAAEAMDMAGDDVFLLLSAAVAAYAAALWLVSRTVAQQLATMVCAMLTAAALTNQLVVGDALPGFAAWGVALVWLLLAWGRLLEPRRFVMVAAAAGMLAGALTTLPTYAGIALALGTALAVVATAVLFRDLLLLAVGAVGTLLVLPSSVIELFPGDVAAPIALLVVGTLLVGAGLGIARRRRAGSAVAPVLRDVSVGTPRAAVTAAGVAAATVTAVIVVLAVV